jgi:hypothetical protein
MPVNSDSSLEKKAMKLTRSAGHKHIGFAYAFLPF